MLFFSFLFCLFEHCWCNLCIIHFIEAFKKCEQNKHFPIFFWKLTILLGWNNSFIYIECFFCNRWSLLKRFSKGSLMHIELYIYIYIINVSMYIYIYIYIHVYIYIYIYTCVCMDMYTCVWVWGAVQSFRPFGHEKELPWYRIIISTPNCALNQIVWLFFFANETLLGYLYWIHFNNYGHFLCTVQSSIFTILKKGKDFILSCNINILTTNVAVQWFCMLHASVCWIF